MKKRSFFIVLAALCLAVLTAASAVTHTEYVRNPSGRTVNVRQGPSKDDVVLKELAPGTKVTVETINGKWSHISEPLDGWIMSRYIGEAPAGKGSGGVIDSTMTRYITSPNGKKVNARTGPGQKGYGVAAQLEPGTEVQLLSTKKGWSAVKYNGFTVYIMSKYLTSTVPGSTPPSFASFDARIYSPNGKSVNMRVKADINSDRITQLEPWTNITVVGQYGNWYRIEYGISTGYVMKKYVR